MKTPRAARLASTSRKRRSMFLSTSRKHCVHGSTVSVQHPLPWHIKLFQAPGAKLLCTRHDNFSTRMEKFCDISGKNWPCVHSARTAGEKSAFGRPVVAHSEGPSPPRTRDAHGAVAGHVVRRYSSRLAVLAHRLVASSPLIECSRWPLTTFVAQGEALGLQPLLRRRSIRVLPGLLGGAGPALEPVGPGHVVGAGRSPTRRR